MSRTVKNISVTYDAINEGNTFSSGDYISGRITLELAKECKIDSLFIKAKGKAEVMWTERHGQTTVVYHSKDKYFSMKQFIIQEQEGSIQDVQNVVAPGCHVYPFTFQIPQQDDMPPSFKGSVGKIIYILEARLSRSMRIDSKAIVEFSFVSKTMMATLNSIPGLMTPQYGTKDKKMKFFTSGTVTMDINLERMGYYQGEGLKVVAVIQNNSSREIKPKYSLYWKHSFFARGKRRLHTHEILKEVGEPIEASATQTVTKVINIPQDTEPSILNCSILKTEYRLKIYLDVPYASDPAVKFPVVILPAAEAPDSREPQLLLLLGQQPPPYSDFGFGAFGNPDQPAWNSAPAAQQFPAAAQFPKDPGPYPPPPAYGSMYPALPDVDEKF